MATHPLFRFLAWPVALGLIAALAALLAFPQLANNGQRQATSSSDFESPVSYSEAVRRAAPAVVNIYTRKLSQRRGHPLMDDPLFRHFFENSDLPYQQRMQSALGSGVIVSDDGYLLTNNHVIEGAEEILVLLHDGREARARLVGSDPDSDLAVLKIELDNLIAIELGRPAQAQVGDVVLAIGNPFGVGQTVTQGIVSATGRYGLGINTYENFIQTDAAINPGNSGGALVDARGRLLGINTAMLDQTGYSVGISFAIPADWAMKSLSDIVAHGTVVRGWLGLDAQQMTPALAQSFGLESTEGVIITYVHSQGPAHRAGINPGDVITHINDVSVGDGRRGMYEVAETPPGDTVRIRLLRGGDTLELEAEVGVRPIETSRS
ncbi:trypsin-like peptidase domain-containing protein [Marinimicrobium alkaliphilum]|uniref:trypsin-like peptidase domain-containing protein n=1 Tax=Marinimicrobium alkaliphilum TaxID=2202654 RepID=UPI000DBA1069|nr:trypsin-like peptidase domain-containing protein [Marinimicrobium alkaliphilum]